MKLFNIRSIGRAAAAGLALWAGLTMAAPIAHVGAAQNTNGAYLFDWRPAGRATVVAGAGRSEATVVTSGPQRVVTLSTPFSVEYFTDDPVCGEQVQVRQDTLQFGVTRTSGTESRGTSGVVTLGTVTTLTGCNAGRVEPFGALDDPGFETLHLAMSLRPSIADLTPGSTIAGPSEDETSDIEQFPAADLMTVQAGSALFAATGNVRPLTTVDSWLVLGLDAGQRAYTRFSVDRRTGSEAWIAAEWSAGLPMRVVRTRMVKPQAGASFGSVRQASRIWESGLSLGTDNPFYYHLYRVGTGERVFKDLVAGTESRSPVTWAFNGLNIETRRNIGPNTGTRTWKPLRNSGTTRFVMEDEVLYLPDGTSSPFIKPRVNVYVDTGAATPPAR